jgi:hypothetical protein
VKRIRAKISAALLGGALLFTGCSNPLTGKPETGDAGENRGVVVVQVGSPARTLQPDLAGFSRYELDFEGPEGASHAKEVIESVASREVSLSPGAWTINASAYTGTGDAAVQAATGSAQVTVSAGQTATAAITLLPYTGGGGGGTSLMKSPILRGLPARTWSSPRRTGPPLRMGLSICWRTARSLEIAPWVQGLTGFRYGWYKGP